MRSHVRRTQRLWEYRDLVTALAYIIGLLVMVIGLGVSIALHEIGHLYPAKKFGVRVGQYMIGFGPTLWSRRIRGTEYGFKLLPLGGYISMAGMYPPSRSDVRAGRAGSGFFRTMVQDARSANDETLAAGDDDHVFYKLPVYKRIIIMLGGPIMNLLFAIVLFAIMFSGIGVSTASTTIASVSECVLPAGSTQTECTGADAVAPAASAGFVPGDRIISIDGTAVSTFAEASALIQAAPGARLDVVVSRNGSEQTLSLTPLLAERPVYDDAGMAMVDANGQPVTQDVGFAGLSPTNELMRQPIWEGPAAAVENVGRVIEIIAQLPVKLYDVAVGLFTGAERDPDGPLSVVGVGRIAGEVAATDAPILSRVGGFVGILGSLNIALFVFNLIPLLPLDGGHVVVALWDGIRRRWAKLFGRPAPAPVDPTKLVPVTFVVVVLMGVMGGILILADLFNPVQLFP